MSLARRARVEFALAGVDISEELNADLLSFSFTDETGGAADDLQVTLFDAEGRWLNWLGAAGAAEGMNNAKTTRAAAKLLLFDEERYGGANAREIDCGTFEIDTISFQNSETTVKATSLPYMDTLRDSKVNRLWEKVTLKAVAAEIAEKNGLALFWDLDPDPSYESLAQEYQSDAAFLNAQCVKAGAILKASDGKLIIVEESTLEQQDAAFDLRREDRGAASVSFSTNLLDGYFRSCHVTSSDGKANASVEATFVAPGAPADGKILEVREKAASVGEALRLAQKRLREKNKSEFKATVTAPCDERYIAGVCVNVSGWGLFDGKYIIQQARHAISGGKTTTTAQMRKCIEGY
jgi:phage protein D